MNNSSKEIIYFDTIRLTCIAIEANKEKNLLATSDFLEAIEKLFKELSEENLNFSAEECAQIADYFIYLKTTLGNDFTTIYNKFLTNNLFKKINYYLKSKLFSDNFSVKLDENSPFLENWKLTSFHEHQDKIGQRALAVEQEYICSNSSISNSQMSSLDKRIAGFGEVNGEQVVYISFKKSPTTTNLLNKMFKSQLHFDTDNFIISAFPIKSFSSLDIHSSLTEEEKNCLNILNRKNSKPTLISSIAYRVAAKKIAKIGHNSVISLLKSKGFDNAQLKAMGSLLDSNYGKAILTFMLGLALSEVSDKTKNEKIALLSDELRAEGISYGAEELCESMLEALASFKEMETELEEPVLQTEIIQEIEVPLLAV